MIVASVPSAPLRLLIVQTDKDEVKVKWEPPSQQNGVIISYVILYHQQKEDHENIWISLEKNGK
jgi:hypothetical protein